MARSAKAAWVPGRLRCEASAEGTVREIQGGRWIAGDFEQDQFLGDGTFVLKWELHWVSGWSPEAGEYRASMVDNYGHADVYRGHIDGDRLVFGSHPGTGPRLRFTWDASEPGVVHWRNEMSVGDADWFLIEEYLMVPVGA